MSDLRFALRQILKSPGYSIVVVLTLAFGIAVNTQIFGTVKIFVLQKMPVPDADSLVLVLQRSEAWNLPHNISFPDFKDYRERSETLQDLVAFNTGPAHLSIEGKAPERVYLEVVTPDAFDAIHVPAAVGRTLIPADGEKAGSAPVVVLSHACWTNRFGADPGVVGRTILLNGRTFTVVGVAREGFTAFATMLDVSAFVPTGAINSLRTEGGGWLEWRSAPVWRALGRLKPGVSLEQARAEIATITAQIVAENPDTHHGVSSVIIPESRSRPDPVIADFLPAVIALFFGLVLLVLFIACANVANLMFARAVTRVREMAIRSALGASRARLIRQLLVESLLLAGVAGVVGWHIASWVGALIQRVQPQNDSVPVAMNFTLGWETYTFTAVISLAAGLACGLLPALRASSVDVVDQIKRGSGGGTRGRHVARNMFVVGQVAFSLVVLVGAALFLRSLARLKSVDLGFRSEHVLVASFDPELQAYDDQRTRAFSHEVLEKLRALPGVDAASITSHVPFATLGINGYDIRPDDPPPQMKQGSTNVSFAVVEPTFHRTLGLRVERGRPLSDTDTVDTPRVAVINQAMADLCWPGRDAIGRRFQPWKDGPFIEVVGIAPTAKYIMLTEEARPYFYLPLGQQIGSPLSIVVRTKGAPGALAGDLRRVVQTVDPNLPLYDVRSHAAVVASSPFPFVFLRIGALVAGIQGAIGLLLAVMGLYSVVAFGVTQRTREIGIRTALGARPAQVVRAILSESLRLTLIGVAAGLVAASLLGLVLSKMLFGVPPFDIVALVAVTLLLLGTSALACVLPARRATRVDPIIALRAE